VARRRPDVALEPPPCPPGWRTGPPDFVGVGAQRAGTSWWFRGAIATHPRFQPPGDLPKELHYFDRFWDGEPEDGFAERYHALFPRPEGAFTGEWTPRYMSDFWPLRLLREAAPEARILVMLRDPVARYRSAIARERALAEQEGTEVALPTVTDALWRGFYAEQLRRVFDAYPREQVLVLQYERCRADPAGQLAATCRFLGIEVPSAPDERLLRPPGGAGHARPQLPDRIRDDLVAAWREDIARLAALCPEIDVSLWPSFAEG
jgi:hypothetical protein